MTNSTDNTNSTNSNDIAANLVAIKQQINTAAADYGRDMGQNTHQGTHQDGENIDLVCVSKTIEPERIIVALGAGQRVFGENRVQEAANKWPDLKKQFSQIELHLIGPLQTNKVALAVKTFDVIQTVDREKLARALANEMEKTNKHLPIYIQVNTGLEEQKAGIDPKEADKFISLCRDELKLNVVGLMCVPPVGDEPALHFALLAKIAKRNNVKNLSMGMSGDFETAIQFGATHVRIGSAIFGARN